MKVRGFRIELGEVETALLSQASVREAVVLCREDRAGQKQLVAYVVSSGDDELNEGALLKSLADSLPAYMIPVAIEVLPALPLSLNGKVDRDALPAPSQRASDRTKAAPTSWSEVQVAAIWKAILSVPQVGTQDNFFALGGDSLQAMRTLNRIMTSLKLDRSVRALLTGETVAELAAVIEETTELSTAARSSAPKHDTVSSPGPE